MLVGLLALAGVVILLALLAVQGIAYGVWWLVEWWLERREAKRERIERELDRQQEELRSRILELAEALNADAHEARKALIRESFRASGQVPPRDD